MRIRFAILIALSTILAGCFGDGDNELMKEDVQTPIWTDYQMVDPIPAIPMGVHHH